MRVWTCFRTSNESISSSGVQKALTGAGIQSISENGLRVGPGLLFFDCVSPELCDFLNEVTQGGTERVLAIGSSRSSFSSDSSWSLLNAGAADVFAWDHSENPAEEIAARLQR
jgi:hypothetical protein